MALELNGTTGVSLVQDGVVTAADLASGAITSAALPSGSVVAVRTYTNNTRTVLSNSNNSNYWTVTDAKTFGTETKIVVLAHIGAFGDTSGVVGSYISYDGTRSYSLDYAYVGIDASHTANGQATFTGLSAGNKTLQIGWQTANNNATDKPFKIFNPNTTDDARQVQKVSHLTVFEVVA